jgi:predicted molibdopterin-dependent oxidoreductase YjgC
MENSLFLHDRVNGFEAYRTGLLAMNYYSLVRESGVAEEIISTFAESCNLQMNAIIIFSEKEISGNTGKELYNFALITGKSGKTSSGLMVLKEKNNSQGLFDMGVSPDFGIGGQSLSDPIYISRCQEHWKLTDVPDMVEGCLHTRLNNGEIKNLFIFGEDPVGCSIDRDNFRQLWEKVQFKVVQDYFITPTAATADVILPASFPIETGGTFTNTQKRIQEFQPVMKSPIAMNSLQQLSRIIKSFGLGSDDNPYDILAEFIALLPEKKNHGKFNFEQTPDDNNKRFFNHGCDAVVKRFDEEFKHKLKLEREYDRDILREN